jgi:tripartite-type tricarboxylate transporter receptor subunit TctC
MAAIAAHARVPQGRSYRSIGATFARRANPRRSQSCTSAVNPGGNMFARMVYLVAGLCLGAGALAAQTYPAEPITVIVSFAAGTGSDITTRMIIDQMQKDTGAQFVVDNRPGANGVIGVTAMLRARPDGHTIMMSGTSVHSLGPSLSKAATYDPVKDFSHISILTLVPFTVLVPSASKFATIAELVAEVRKSPGKLTYGFASGSTRIFGVKFHQATGLDSLPVPYKSSQEALTDLLGNQLDYMVVDSTAAAGIVRGGRARALAVLSPDRTPLLPGVPSLRDAGLPVYSLVGWTGLAGPAAMPAAARKWLADAAGKALANPTLVERIRIATAEAARPMDPDAWVQEQLANWSDAARQAGVVPE